jgi:DNA topoisomerase-3
MEIARVDGATEKQAGYMQGGDYLVTWALGHLVQLALPSCYGQARPSAENLPLLPDPFQLVIRQRKGEKGYETDPAAARQLGVIDSVLSRCSSIIVATDAGREGELIFRYIQAHTACALPFRRLWISSLTDEAIRKGLENLRDGTEYDRLYGTADCRAKADWLVGINASQALAVASGAGNHSLGRVQTPTLAMIASRYLENRGFLPSDYWSLSVTLGKGDALRKFRYIEDLKDKATAEAVENRLRSCREATVGKMERKTVHETPPLLYDLTALQKECNVHHDMSAEQTLDAAQSLYEKKLISYPRTGSRYIPSDMEPQIPSLLRMILRMEPFAYLVGAIDPLRTTRRSVDSSKVTDHHALIITGNFVRETLTDDEERVYEMICGRMLEAFGPRCEKDTMLIEATIDEMLFRSRSAEVVSAGWRAVYNRPEEPGGEDDDIGAAGIEYAEGETLTVMGHSLAKGKTRPKPFYTEATLLSAMESAGKDIPDEKAREAMKDCGIGTPATRAATIETLLKREYIERSGKSLIPTEKGLYIHRAVRDMRIADPQLTGEWEKALAMIEKGEMKPESFLEAIRIYTRQVTKEVLSLKFPQSGGGTIPCPKCGNGRIVIRHRVAKCDSDKCGLVVFRKFLNKELTDQHLAQLLSSGTTKLIKGFRGKRDASFDAKLTFDKNFNVVFAPKEGAAKTIRKRPPKRVTKAIRK